MIFANKDPPLLLVNSRLLCFVLTKIPSSSSLPSRRRGCHASPLPRRRPREREREIEEEVTKLKIVVGNWRKEGEVFETSGRFSPEKPSLPTELAHRILNPSKTFNDTGGFSFPVLNPPAINSSAEDPARVSLEVFRPSEELGVLRKSAEFQRKTMASFGANYPASPKGRGAAAAEDDVASDRSSDLFEIESFSTQYRRPDSLDELTAGLDARRLAGTANGIRRLQRSIEEVGAPSECYAPSEVSVEWSVVTAEGFDRASVANFSSTASEFEELRYAGAEHDRLSASTTARCRDIGGRLPSFLRRLPSSDGRSMWQSSGCRDIAGNWRKLKFFFLCVFF